MSKISWFPVALKVHHKLEQTGHGQKQSALKKAAVEAGVSLPTLRGYLQAVRFVIKVKEQNGVLAKALETQTSAAVGVLARWGRRDFKAALQASISLVEDGLTVQNLMKQEADLRPYLENWQIAALEKIDNRLDWLSYHFGYHVGWECFERACRPEIVNIDLPVPFNQLSIWPQPEGGLPNFLGVRHHLSARHSLGGFWMHSRRQAVDQRNRDEYRLDQLEKISEFGFSRKQQGRKCRQEQLLQLEVERIKVSDGKYGHALSFGSVFEGENNRIAKTREQLVRCIASSTIYSNIMLILPDKKTHHQVASRISEIAEEEANIDLQNDHGKQLLSILVSNEDPIQHKLLIDGFDRSDERKALAVLSIRTNKSSGLVSVFAPETFFQFLSPYGALLEFCYIQSGWREQQYHWPSRMFEMP